MSYMHIKKQKYRNYGKQECRMIAAIDLGIRSPLQLLCRDFLCERKAEMANFNAFYDATVSGELDILSDKMLEDTPKHTSKNKEDNHPKCYGLFKLAASCQPSQCEFADECDGG